MTTTAKRFRIPCPCGADLVVGSGQAGGQVVCDRCGGAITVPRLRDLEALALPRETVSGRRWRPADGWMLGGGLVAALATVAAVLVPQWVGGGPRRLPNEMMIRTAIESVDAATVYRAWQAMRGSGIDRGTLPEELRLQQAAGAAGRIAAVFWTIAAAGGLAVALGGAGCLIGPRPSRAGAVARGGHP